MLDQNTKLLLLKYLLRERSSHNEKSRIAAVSLSIQHADGPHTDTYSPSAWVGGCTAPWVQETPGTRFAHSTIGKHRIPRPRTPGREAAEGLGLATLTWH